MTSPPGHVPRDMPARQAPTTRRHLLYFAYFTEHP